MGELTMSKPCRVVSLQTYRFATNYSNPSRAYKLLNAFKPMPSKSPMSKYYATFMYNSKIHEELDAMLVTPYALDG